MKTLSNTLFAALLTAVVFTSSAFTATAAEPTTVVSSEAGVNKIWVSGNVKLVLTQGDQESIKGTENFNADKTSVLRKGQTLYINSMEASQVTINISVKDLQRIEAYGQSVVVTSNNFDVKYLQLFLSQSATAKIKTTTGSLYTVINDKAVLKISGAAEQHTLVANNMKNIKFNNFASARTSQYATEAIMEADRSALAIAK
ncbi:MAG: DUF2807 domain-containing protein [Bacteroidota bacterium]